MPIVVEVKSEADYAAWVDKQRKEMLAKADDPNKEWDAASPGRARREGLRGQLRRLPPGHRPGRAAARSRRSPTRRRCSGKQDDQIHILLNGVVKNGTPTAMASFKQLSDTEIAAVITYTRNNWGNKPEDNLVQPKDVAAARK